MRVVIFCHSLRSDWNHGNAHFLRGVATELIGRGHEVAVYEPADSWSVANLIRQHGTAPLDAFQRAYPLLRPHVYDPRSLDVEDAVDGTDIVLVHEWNEPELVAAVGRARAAGGRFRLLFHDTHHRAVTAPEAMARYDLSQYDGVLAFGTVVRDIYIERGWAARAWVWHEAADTRVFHPPPAATGQDDYDGPAAGELIWIGNWGDNERTAELREFLVGPVRALGLRAGVYGVRYPVEALDMLRRAGIRYGGWLPNFAVPRAFARHRVTVHVPRRPYVRALPGVPTIRPFEALACGIPLVCAPWHDTESLFRPGVDYLQADDTMAMSRHLRDILHDDDLARELAARGLETIRSRHTCAHRVSELLEICQTIAPVPTGTRGRGHDAPRETLNSLTP